MACSDHPRAGILDWPEYPSELRYFGMSRFVASSLKPPRARRLSLALAKCSDLAVRPHLQQLKHS